MSGRVGLAKTETMDSTGCFMAAVAQLGGIGNSSSSRAKKVALLFDQRLWEEGGTDAAEIHRRKKSRTFSYVQKFFFLHDYNYSSLKTLHGIHSRCSSRHVLYISTSFN